MLNIVPGPGRWSSALLLALWGLCNTAKAEEQPLITDRPDQTESAFTVPPGLFQIEGGWTYGERTDTGANVTFQAFPQALLRIGLSKIFELRFQVPGIEIERTDSTPDASTVRGLIDATLGFKVVIRDAKGGKPQTALLGTLSVPSGDDDFSSNRVDPSFRFAFSNTLSPRLSLGYNIGMLWRSETDAEGTLDTLCFLDWTLALGIGATERLGVFVEMFGLTPVDAETPQLTAFNTGLTHLLTRGCSSMGRRQSESLRLLRTGPLARVSAFVFPVTIECRAMSGSRHHSGPRHCAACPFD